MYLRFLKYNNYYCSIVIVCCCVYNYAGYNYAGYDGSRPVLVHVDPSRSSGRLVDGLVVKPLPPIHRNDVPPPFLPPGHKPPPSPSNGIDAPPKNIVDINKLSNDVDRHSNLASDEKNDGGKKDSFGDLEKPVPDGVDSKDLSVQLQEMKVSICTV